MIAYLIHRIVLLSLLASAIIVTATDQAAKGMPKDVASFISRTLECNHWVGEDPYDTERAKQINHAVQQSGCAKLGADERALRRKYRNNPKVLKAIDDANSLIR